jgi:GT2 family glycosyltransferase
VRPKVAIVILNYNGRDLLERYLSSVESLEYSNYEILLVDNDSNDSSVNYVNEHHPDVTVVESEKNLGFSQGNNLGAASAENADYYWFLNTDVRVTRESLDLLVDRIESEDDVGIVVPQIKNIDDGSIQSLGYKYGIFGVPRARTEVANEELEKPHGITYGSGAALLIDSHVWEEIGGFDDENFMYGDDTYLCLNAWLRGHRVEVVPNSIVYHEGEASQSKNQGPLIAYHNARGRTRCYLLTLGSQSLVFGSVGFVSHSAIRVIKDLLNSNFETAAARTRGYLHTLLELPDILSKRRQHQRDRRLGDNQFFSKNFVNETIRRSKPWNDRD